MAIYEVVRSGVLINTIMLNDNAVVISPKEAAGMPLEWLRAWDFYVVDDDTELVKISDEESEPFEFKPDWGPLNGT